MKIVRYRHDGREHYGALEGDTVVPMEGSLDALTKTPRAKSIRLDAVRILAPVAPGKIVAAGLNYGEFVREQKVDPPAEPLIFLKPPTAVIGPNDAIIYPRQTRELYYEGELAIVIARKASRVPPSDARRYVLGYTCMNDVTAGDLQARDHEFTRSKSFDTFAPLGPVIETAIENPDALHLTTKLNGKLRQNTSTSDLIFKCDFLLSFISHIMTLLPGDVISTGTPPGVGQIKAGDIIEIEIEQIGILTNIVTEPVSSPGQREDRAKRPGFCDLLAASAGVRYNI
jgi:2-keto-4-pentenoate hydratase/2-oxohepta-3-ene-1,7-dioic acid hydratase in catechol pathway